jgi:4-hydroxybenzoyl-CoA reductase subunit alpha
MSSFAYIGKPAPMLDAKARVSGVAQYTADMTLPGMLYGKILHSTVPHARIVRIDVSKAQALAGVHAVVVGAEFPNRYGILPVGHDESALAVGKVRYVGDNVAAVAADTAALAEEALALIDVEYEKLPAWFDAESAMAAERDFIHDDRPHNIEKHYEHNFGDVEAGFAASYKIREHRFTCPAVTHAAMEPHATLAEMQRDGGIIVWSSTQVPYYLQRTIAGVLEMPESSVRVIKPALGGGFGAKSEVCPLEVITAMLAKKAGMPVRITYSREEVFFTHRGRPAQTIDLKTGVDRDGKILAVQARTVQDGGAFCGYGPVTVLYSGSLLGALYDIRNMRYDGFRVLTNKPSCGAMRGHGTVNMRFAFESQLDMLARDLDIDPAEIRRSNLLQAPCITVNNLRVTSYGFPECIEKVVEASGWRERKGRLPRGRGLGLAGSHYVSGAANPINRSELPHSSVTLKADRDGAVTIYSGASEIGQGSDVLQVRIVAETLGIDPERVRLIAADTGTTPVDLGSYSSRVTFMCGNAAMRAGQNLKEQIMAAAARKLARPVEELTLSYDEALKYALAENGAIVAQGHYSPPSAARGGKFKGAGVGPSPSYSYSAQVAEVVVDEETGQVHIEKIWAAHDCGRALNPLAVEGQIIGSVSMGLGQALQEEMIWRNGFLMNPGLLEYRSPASGDQASPQILHYIVESIDPEGPFGAKEASEGSLAASIPAVANAIFDAVGARIFELPLTPERILRALKAGKP